ncbi:hypothetical protein PR003_g21291 [Phytophthora rubi]|uniref:Uncharacterized protein n=1 Tax=Phytophthora rubi TaxID=129364 RepID=A0A6A4DEF9_9STRA|nr:hypothetical protein PR003_g21291 [Phytophthora rubi]
MGIKCFVYGICLLVVRQISTNGAGQHIAAAQSRYAHQLGDQALADTV